jgi:hypothetical protein
MIPTEPKTRLDAIPSRAVLTARIGANPLVAPGGGGFRRAPRPVRPAQASALRSLPGIDAETVIHRLEEAGHTLLCLPTSGHSTALRQTRHAFVAEAVEAFSAVSDSRPRPPVPPAIRITRMDQALAWIPLIPAEKLVLRRIVGCRSLVSPLTGRHLFTWRRLARLLGADHKAIQRWHASGIDMIVATLNRDAELARSWDTLG